MSQAGAMKRKRDHTSSKVQDQAVDTTKPTAIFHPAKGRPYTVTVALPGSVIANAQTHDLKTSLCGNIARALAVFCVDEIVIFDDGCNNLYQRPQDSQHAAQDAQTGYSAYSDPSNFMYHILSYLETPPVLRRILFPHHPNLRTAGSLPSLDIPSHLRETDWCQYREGVTVEGPSTRPGKKGQHARPLETYVQAGIGYPVLLSPSPEVLIPPHTRVTLRFPGFSDPEQNGTHTAEAVDPALPREEGGFYWGYTTRVASNLSEVFTESPYDDGYDYSIGMSERGTPLQEILAARRESSASPNTVAPPSTWNHLLVVFGGPPGLEKAVQNDPILATKSVTEASEVFDAWINLMQGQGSRTIRTEEALWIGLMACWEIVTARANE